MAKKYCREILIILCGVIAVILGFIVGYGSGIGIMYAMSKNPGPYGTPIFDANGTIIIANFKVQVLEMALIFGIPFMLISAVCYGMCAMSCIETIKENESKNDNTPNDEVENNNMNDHDDTIEMDSRTPDSGLESQTSDD